jgi:hypothetical protein
LSFQWFACWVACSVRWGAVNPKAVHRSFYFYAKTQEHVPTLDTLLNQNHTKEIWFVSKTNHNIQNSGRLEEIKRYGGFVLWKKTPNSANE